MGQRPRRHPPTRSTPGLDLAVDVAHHDQQAAPRCPRLARPRAGAGLRRRPHRRHRGVVQPGHRLAARARHRRRPRRWRRSARGVRDGPRPAVRPRRPARWRGGGRARGRGLVERRDRDHHRAQPQPVRSGCDHPDHQPRAAAVRVHRLRHAAAGRSDPVVQGLLAGRGRADPDQLRGDHDRRGRRRAADRDGGRALAGRARRCGTPVHRPDPHGSARGRVPGVRGRRSAADPPLRRRRRLPRSHRVAGGAAPGRERAPGEDRDRGAVGWRALGAAGR
jgi:hypothetical protein